MVSSVSMVGVSDIDRSGQYIPPRLNRGVTVLLRIIIISIFLSVIVHNVRSHRNRTPCPYGNYINFHLGKSIIHLSHQDYILKNALELRKYWTGVSLITFSRRGTNKSFQEIISEPLRNKRSNLITNTFVKTIRSSIHVTINLRRGQLLKSFMGREWR